MSVVAFFRHGLRLLVPLAVACTIYLYLYPVFGGCAFPDSSRDPKQAFEQTKKLHWPYSQPVTDGFAPFRLLALGDPQLEGDTSIPIHQHGTLPHLKKIANHVRFKTKHSSLWERLRMISHDTVDFYFEDIPNLLESARKVFDHFGNDFYLAHIYRTLHWWTRPTHVSVLGDLLGSQWISDAEFERRGWRFWNRAFRGAERLPDELAVWPKDEYDVSGYLNTPEEAAVWSKRLLNVAGNHDIGYAGDLTKARLERFERLFGKANYELRFELPITDPKINATISHDESNTESVRLPPEIRILVLNDMNLDTPAKDNDLQDQTYEFINAAIGASASVEYQGHYTIILAHIPLHKPEGICVDAPFFDFHANSGGVKEQNMLSTDASKGFLEGLFGISADTGAAGGGLGRHGILLNGHDHEGCDTFHYVNHSHGEFHFDREWQVLPWAEAEAQGLPSQQSTPGRREITVRSMMGGFGGNAGLLSVWFDHEAWEWRSDYVDCPLGTQHFWWFAHILDFAALVAIALYGLVLGLMAAGVDVDGRCCQGVRWVGRRLGLAKGGKPKGTVVSENGKHKS
ncbi:Protein TED1 [Paramyrothecium foliicola]|nr:Protein TED1 [Paramyrothecium foliicola]